MKLLKCSQSFIGDNFNKELHSSSCWMDALSFWLCKCCIVRSASIRICCVNWKQFKCRLWTDFKTSCFPFSANMCSVFRGVSQQGRAWSVPMLPRFSQEVRLVTILPFLNSRLDSFEWWSCSWFYWLTHYAWGCKQSFIRITWTVTVAANPSSVAPYRPAF